MRLGPGVVSETEEIEVCVAFDVVEFVYAVPCMPSKDELGIIQRSLRCGNATAPVTVKSKTATTKGENPPMFAPPIIKLFIAWVLAR